MSINFTENEKKYLKRMAALQFNGSKENYSTRHPIHFLQEQSDEYNEVAFNDYDDFRDEIVKIDYCACDDFESYETVEELVANHLGLDCADREAITDFNTKAKENKEPLFVSYDEAAEKGISGVENAICDLHDYLLAYGLEPQCVSLYKYANAWEVKAVSFTHKGAVELREKLDNHIFRPTRYYRGTGTVVTPTSDAYKLKNYSTVNMDNNATIVDIVKLTKYSQVLDTEHSDENIVAIAYNPTEGKYMWWYSMPEAAEFDKYEGEGWVVNRDVTDKNLNASGECFVIYIDGAWDFKAAGILDDVTLRQSVDRVDANHPLTQDLVFGEWNFGKTPIVGDSIEGGKDEGLAIKVTELQAVPATWRIVPVSTGISDIRRGELAMSIAPTKAIEDASAIDLAKCSAPIDITERGWFLDAPAIGADGKTVDVPTELPLITSARMAGGNVNPAGCTSVVRVIYTVTPMFSINDGQTGTVGADAVTSNR